MRMLGFFRTSPNVGGGGGNSKVLQLLVGVTSLVISTSEAKSPPQSKYCKNIT